ncbi:MAG TPA: hypothetical protein VG713_00135 [Pirellulales bacterium]|nr:hypothetical protein [Pirellulales bacterium]
MVSLDLAATVSKSSRAEGVAREAALLAVAGCLVFDTTVMLTVMVTAIGIECAIATARGMQDGSLYRLYSRRSR